MNDDVIELSKARNDLERRVVAAKAELWAAYQEIDRIERSDAAQLDYARVGHAVLNQLARLNGPGTLFGLQVATDRYARAHARVWEGRR